MAIRTTVNQHIAERATAILTTTIRDLDGDALPAASLSTLTLTLYDQDSGSIINEREQVNILNANGGTVNSVGGLTLRLDPDDTVITDDEESSEWHIALLEWTWVEASVTYYGKAEIKHKVRNLAKVPAE